MSVKVEVPPEWLDITAPEEVEIQIRHDGKVIWVNIDGIARFRACRIGKLILNDERISRRKKP